MTPGAAPSSCLRKHYLWLLQASWGCMWQWRRKCPPGVGQGLLMLPTRPCSPYNDLWKLLCHPYALVSGTEVGSWDN